MMFLVFCVLVVSSIAGISQNTSESIESSVVSVGSTSATSMPSDEESAIPFSPSPQTQHKSRSPVWGYVRMIVILIFLVVCVYIVMRFMRSSGFVPADDDPFLRRVASISISVGKSVQIVTLLEHAYLIGVTDSSINLLGEIEDKELVNALNLYADKTALRSKARNFSDVLSLFMTSKTTTEKNTVSDSVFSGTSKSMSDFIKSQRERINGGE